ncbi:MAG TPA: hypothetical protein VGO13_10405 [Solirubrobacterales bacterium]|jgi:hypothetical protein|nr:hypothetical protein [Solirubrobacterales bacterium]
MKRLKGPEIKMPKVRMPQFLVDLYYDLDERHLLPVVAVLVVGIIAVPLLLGGSSDSAEESTGAEAAATASAAAGPKTSALVVAKESPNLREYKRRLEHLHPKDPFRPQGSETASGEGSASSSSSESTESSGGESPATTESGGETGGTPIETTTHRKVTFFTYAIDVRVAPLSAGNGKPSQAEPTVRRNLPPLVMLPSRDTPALTYIGPSHDGKKAIMLVSSDVVSLFGDSKCVVGSTSCQMLALEPGVPETIVYGPAARTYRVELLKIQVVTSEHLNRAALGKPKHGKSKQSGSN